MTPTKTKTITPYVGTPCLHYLPLGPLRPLGNHLPTHPLLVNPTEVMSPYLSYYTPPRPLPHPHLSHCSPKAITPTKANTTHLNPRSAITPLTIAMGPLLPGLPSPNVFRSSKI